MQKTPIVNGENGRDPGNGRFIPGCPPGPGRPVGRLGALRRLLNEIDAELARLLDAGELQAMLARCAPGHKLTVLMNWLKQSGLLALWLSEAERNKPDTVYINVGVSALPRSNVPTETQGAAEIIQSRAADRDSRVA